MTKKAVREIIESYMESEVSEETRVAFEKWLSDGSSCEEKEEALSSIWENLSLTSAASPEDPYSIIEEAQQIENVETRKKTKRKTTWLWIMSSVAACMTIFAIIGWSIPSHNETCLVSSVDSKGEFVLPDGSHVWLNRNSRLRYYNDLQGKLRKVRIEGEGYFDVAKDPEHPFVVEAGDLSITALGTSFTVSAYDNAPIKAYLEDGCIEVKAPSNEPVILMHDYAVLYDAREKKLVSYSENASDHTAWIDGKLEFVNKSLADIIDCLEHWYCIDISCNDMETASKIHLSMVIRQESIGEICSAISLISDISYFIDDKGSVKISFPR